MNLPLILRTIMDELIETETPCLSSQLLTLTVRRFSLILTRFTIETAPAPASCQLPNLTLTLTPSCINLVELQTGGVVSVSDGDDL